MTTSDENVRNRLSSKWKRLLIWWALWSCLVLLLLAGIWFWNGMPRGPEGLVRTWGMMIVISVLTPPVVWIIGKLL